MDKHWTGTVEIAVPIDRVCSYLADFPKHAEWAQTVVNLELKQPGDANGIGAVYTTSERQAMQSDRKPNEPLTKGFKGKTQARITELNCPARIAWHSHPVPISMGIHADLSFDLAAIDDRHTRVTQTVDIHQPAIPLWIFRTLVFRVGADEMERRAEAQWQASLNNIKTVLESAG